MVFNYKSNDSKEIIESTFKTQRTMLGILCLLLAPLSIGLGLFGINTNPVGWYESISDTYYANSKFIMIGVLFLTSYYFFTYRGYDIKDRIVNWISSFSALGVIMFPCKGTDGFFNFAGHENICIVLHGVSAGILFTSFAINCFWLFRLGNSNTEAKKKKNKLFIISGIGIIFGLLFLIARLVFGIPDYFIAIGEFIMLSSYSFAWFVKSGLIVKE